MILMVACVKWNNFCSTVVSKISETGKWCSRLQNIFAHLEPSQGRKKDLLKVFNKAFIRDSSSKSSKHILISLSDDCIGPDLFGLDLQKTCYFVL